jgi:predicted ATP-dependent endonuclease of OLD family
MLAERLLNTEWTLEYNEKNVQMPHRLKSAHEFLKTAVQEFPLWKDDVKPKLRTTLSKYVGRDAKIEMRPSIQSLEEWLKQQILLSFSADYEGTPTPIETMGDGWQSLIRLAALDVLSQFDDQIKDKVVLLFEEPETHLHPHLRRHMRGVLGMLAQKGWYVITTTHSPAIVNLQTSQQIVRIERKGSHVFERRLDTSSVPDTMKIQSKINNSGNGEIFFASGVILCEGPHDEFALRTILEALDFNLDVKSISITGVDSKNNAIGYIRLLKSLGIPWCSILDEDRTPSGVYKGNSERLNQEIEDQQGERDLCLFWRIDLEHCFGIERTPENESKPSRKATPEWQQNRISALNIDELSYRYPEIFRVISEVSAWLNPDRTDSESSEGA